MGNAWSQGLDDAGYGDELSTNRGYNKRIPPSEGGVLDDRGRQTRGEHFEGQGGPGDKYSQANREQGGRNDNDVVDAPFSQSTGLGSAGDIATQGKQASRANVGSNPPGPGGAKFKGENYYTPESVPDSISAEGWVAPESITEASREAERLE
ncbi:hypothetical protein BGZ61DRAFT_540930 [Ilyonectria robusta]|uniref:uncharacterized protein n=1 Tax=Ilyonectria robusta TaxID=1079257 RepID=UPI001E8D9061|nr:uncharacterized protein BGZ61DRAFT_540930 [Ilyonectria robusta]KAH8656478.1 hypothetical protein BGZ61DRAFT_540930 [Ilyonectria robusta]